MVGELGLGNRRVEALVRALKALPMLEYLNLAGNRLTVGMTPASKHMLKNISALPRLRYLNLSASRVSAGAGSALAALILRSPALESLVLRKCKISDPVMLAICKAHQRIPRKSSQVIAIEEARKWGWSHSESFNNQ